MKKWELRREALLEELKKEGKLSLEQITGLLRISESTARRLIIELEKDQYLIRCFGGVQALSAPVREYSYAETKDVNSAQKSRIGEYAAGLADNGDVLFLSGGSTLKYMALALANRFETGALKQVSIITNSLVASEVLSDYANVIVPGGIYRRNLQVLDGSLTEKNLRSMCFTKAFLGAVSFNDTEGFMTSDIETNSIHEIVISKSAGYYVLADSSKFGKHALVSYGKLNEAAGIITDSGLKEDTGALLVSGGVNFIIV